ncbi:ABC transporter ATP-binding protein [Streptomyces sp. NPDC048496]|uniref:ABC transporter ATP-binding protein n=1 Tax=Streptomyces sp. NPDC048496 TaxID=3365558 RepID=UPI0037245105
MTDRPPVTLSVQSVRKSYVLRGQRVDVLDNAALELPAGRITALIGRSGSGKTTLLQIMGLLLPPDSGTVLVDGCDAWSLPERERTRLRRSSLGFVFQAFNLLPQHSALRNAALPYLGSTKAGAQQARDLLERVGLADRAEHHPSELSAGEQQRVALARALVNNPGTVLADEPTGNLDADSEQRMLELFRQVADEGRAVLLVTHSATVASYADSVLRMDRGALTTEEDRDTDLAADTQETPR